MKINEIREHIGMLLLDLESIGEENLTAHQSHVIGGKLYGLGNLLMDRAADFFAKSDRLESEASCD